MPLSVLSQCSEIDRLTISLDRRHKIACEKSIKIHENTTNQPRPFINRVHRVWQYPFFRSYNNYEMCLFPRKLLSGLLIVLLSALQFPVLAQTGQLRQVLKKMPFRQLTIFNDHT